MTIVFLSGDGVLSNYPIEDEWYRFTSLSPVQSKTVVSKGSTPLYLPEEPASPLGCVEQTQYCNLALPGEVGCGPLRSYHDAYAEVAPLFNTTAEALQSDHPFTSSNEARLAWFISIRSKALTINQILQFLGPKSLASQDSLFGGIQYYQEQKAPLWHLDVTNWFSTILASLQTAFILTALGPSSDVPIGDQLLPVGKVQEDLCKSQVSI